MKHVFCVGEALIDFICTDVESDLVQGHQFLKKAGGAPANVAAAITKLGGVASFFGKVGSDAFGRFLIQEMTAHGIDCRYVVQDQSLPTTLAFVSLKADGERDFEFFRGADGHLRYDEIDPTVLRKYGLYHFGSATALMNGILHATYMALLRFAKGSGKVVSFDPNYRNLLWKEDTAIFVDRVKECLKYVDFIKLSDEEAHLIFGEKTYDAIAEDVHQYGVKALAITCGKEGTYLSVSGQHDMVGSISVDAVDSTGAGDAFIGAMLYQLALADDSQQDLSSMETMKAYTAFSNKVGAITCTKFGAMEAMPTLEQLAFSS